MKKILCAVLMTALLVCALSVFAIADSQTLPFTDVPQKQWFYSKVVDAYTMGIMKGKTATKFDPLATITRAEVVTILANLAKLEKDDIDDFDFYMDNFSDADYSAWYADYMGWAYEKGIIAGYTDGTLKPNAKITRAEIVKMAGNFLNYMCYDLVETKPDVSFTDAKKLQSWYKPELMTLATAGVINGKDGGKFDPTGDATRAEAATIFTTLAKAIDTGLETNGVVMGHKGEKSPYVILYTDGSDTTDLKYIRDRIDSELNLGLAIERETHSYKNISNAQIVVNKMNDPDCAALYNSLADGEFAFRMIKADGALKLVMAYTTEMSRTYAVEYLLTKYMTDGVLRVPVDLDYKQAIKYEDFFTNYDSITSAARDPFLFYDNGTYYIYTTTGNNSKPWRMWKNTQGLNSDTWEGPFYDIFELPADFNGHAWAPEVHKYNGSYYMFATYRSDNKLNDYTNHGVAIFKADSPEGPFKLHSDGWITYKKWSDEVDGTKWDTIDGTLYIDADGQPWIIFTHEHTSMPDGNGSFMAAKLSADLSEIISEPFDLFYAKDPDWEGDGITDGCFPYVTEDGDLLIMWSNFTSEDYSYVLAFARSSDGTLYGDWSHDEQMLYNEYMTGVDSGGGHGMIFTDVDGQMYICCHSPTANIPEGERELVTLFPVIERNGQLVWDLNLD